MTTNSRSAEFAHLLTQLTEDEKLDVIADLVRILRKRGLLTEEYRAQAEALFAEAGREIPAEVMSHE